MKSVTVCIPVLKRYDLLKLLISSLQYSTITPKNVMIINNGRDIQAIEDAIAIPEVRNVTPIGVLTPGEPMGVAESWNWFIQNVPEERVISNDDVTFAPDSLEKLLASRADLVWSAGFGFSCFVIRDACVEKLGLFDETISPGYGYYEDDDYLQRLDGRGTRAPSAVAENVDSGIQHYHSATLKASTWEELQEHHRKFKIAQKNYKAKWPECGL